MIVILCVKNLAKAGGIYFGNGVRDAVPTVLYAGWTITSDNGLYIRMYVMI